MNNGGFSSGMLGNFIGIKIVVNDKMITFFRKPRSKSKRILKKWKKDTKNYKPSRDIILNREHRIMHCHSIVYEQLKQEFGKGII